MIPKLFSTGDVVNWYFDQSGAWLGVITALMLVIMIVKKLNCNQDPKTGGTKYEKSLKLWIYSLYFSHLFFMTSTIAQVSMLPILKASGIIINQQKTCKIILVHMHIFASWYHISIFNIFMERLYRLFQKSVFEISKYKNTVIRTIHFIVWLIIGVSSAFITDPSPYNIYTSSVDLNGDGVTCSLFTSDKVDFDTNLILFSAGMAILIGNILAWALFMYQFYTIIKFTTNVNKNKNVKKNDDLLKLMKEQTLIVALSVSSTLIFYMIQMTGILGQFFVTLDFVITPFIIFLCFKCNRYYFQLLRCDKLAVCCCKGFEKRVIKKVMDEKIAASIAMAQIPKITPTSTVSSQNASIDIRCSTV